MAFSASIRATKCSGRVARMGACGAAAGACAGTAVLLCHHFGSATHNTEALYRDDEDAMDEKKRETEEEDEEIEVSAKRAELSDQDANLLIKNWFRTIFESTAPDKERDIVNTYLNDYVLNHILKVKLSDDSEWDLDAYLNVYLSNYLGEELENYKENMPKAWLTELQGLIDGKVTEKVEEEIATEFATHFNDSFDEEWHKSLKADAEEFVGSQIAAEDHIGTIKKEVDDKIDEELVTQEEFDDRAALLKDLQAQHDDLEKQIQDYAAEKEESDSAAGADKAMVVGMGIVGGVGGAVGLGSSLAYVYRGQQKKSTAAPVVAVNVQRKEEATQPSSNKVKTPDYIARPEPSERQRRVYGAGKLEQGTSGRRLSAWRRRFKTGKSRSDLY